MKTHSLALSVCFLASAFASGCDDGPVVPGIPTPDPGAIVRVSANGMVGVVLDEFPASIRDRVAKALMNKPESFWVVRAKDHMRLTTVRLNYRQFYYPPEEMKLQLPLPPEPVQRFAFDANGPQRMDVGGRDMVVLGYQFNSYVITTTDSVPASEPALGVEGGTWDEAIQLPIDPTLLFERTGYACMSELGPPPESVQTENAYTFYDDTCQVELPGAPFCHFTLPGPEESCVEALDRATGRFETVFHYERVAWDEAIASEYRVGQVTQTDYPDMAVRSDFLANNHIVYRYFPEGHCTLNEKCVGAPGWRRLLAFDAVDENVGGAPLHIGPVDYLLTGMKPEVETHGMYEFDECHQHYHFQHYGTYNLNGPEGVAGYKVGFCLISTDRTANHELAPMSSPYTYCDYQGTSAGWSDTYQAGIACQWLDITDADVGADPMNAALSFHSNPDGFLCEGELVLDGDGNQVWEPTEFKTSKGDPVDRPKCNFFEGSEDNDVGETTVRIEERGGVMTSPCRRNQVGPIRNCEFQEMEADGTCTPGEEVTLSCSVADPDAPQALRVCEYSIALGHSVTCSAVEAAATSVIDGSNVQVKFKCPEARDAVEIGGRYALFTGPAWNEDKTSQVTCAPMP